MGTCDFRTGFRQDNKRPSRDRNICRVLCAGIIGASDSQYMILKCDNIFKERDC